MSENEEDKVDEKFLEDILVKNLSIIESNLKFIERQKHTPAGIIDILAMDKAQRYVIIEIKIDTGKDSTVGQILGYMTALEEELRISRKMLRGIIFCENVTKRVEMACKFVPNLQYIEYKNLNKYKVKKSRLTCLNDEEMSLIRKFRSRRRREEINKMADSPIFPMKDKICIDISE